MSFFTGFVLGQATSNNAPSGGVAAGFFGLFVVAFILVVIASTVASVSLPLYSVLHFAGWAFEEFDPSLGILIALSQTLITLLAYVFVIFGTQQQFGLGSIILGGVNIAALSTANSYKHGPLNGILELEKPSELVQAGFISAGLCVICLLGIRFLITRKVSEDRRAWIVSKAISPLVHAIQSLKVAWLCAGLSVFALSIWGLMLFQQFQRIDKFVEQTGRSYEEGFDFVFYGETYQEQIATGIGVGTLAVICVAHLASLIQRRSGKHQTVADQMG